MVVLITVQNMVGIDAVVSAFSEFGLKMPIYAPFGGFLMHISPK